MSNSDQKAVIVVDFMSMIRKVKFANLNCFKDVFDIVWDMITSACNATQIDVVFDSYLDNSITDCERIRREQQYEALEYVSLTENSPIPVEMERFWASSKNKERLQILSRDFFIKKSKENKEMKILLSGYVTDADGSQPCELLLSGETYEQPNLNSSIEEADCRSS